MANRHPEVNPITIQLQVGDHVRPRGWRAYHRFPPQGGIVTDVSKGMTTVYWWSPVQKTEHSTATVLSASVTADDALEPMPQGSQDLYWAGCLRQAYANRLDDEYHRRFLETRQ